MQNWPGRNPLKGKTSLRTDKKIRQRTEKIYSQRPHFRIKEGALRLMKGDRRAARESERRRQKEKPKEEVMGRALLGDTCRSSDGIPETVLSRRQTSPAEQSILG